MNSFLLVDEEDMEFIWNTIQEHQVVFHPDIAPCGKFDYEKFFAYKYKKPFILFLDRNILSSLLKFCENGSLKNKAESQIVGLIMAWAELNDISISAGLAVQERATQLDSQEDGLIELQKFLEIFDAYTGQLWLRVAEGTITEIPPIVFSNKPATNITAEYASGNDHYYMAFASLLYIVQLYRNKNMKPAEKLQAFFQWSIENLLVCEYLLIYAALLFTGQEGIKAPKHANSDDIEKIVYGCENQAWDISYLTIWSTFYSNTENYKEEFLFATNDILLKRIFINKNGPNGLNGLLYEVFPQKEYNQLLDYFEEKMKNRVKPDFGADPCVYFRELINKEKQQLSKMISC